MTYGSFLPKGSGSDDCPFYWAPSQPPSPRQVTLILNDSTMILTYWLHPTTFGGEDLLCTVNWPFIIARSYQRFCEN